mgnify:CR=1 FL=1
MRIQQECETVQESNEEERHTERTTRPEEKPQKENSNDKKSNRQDRIEKSHVATSLQKQHDQRRTKNVQAVRLAH